METVLLVVHIMVVLTLIVMVLLQRSEGGGLGIGGSPTGALGARGAADFLSRATKWLAVAFVSLSIVLAAVAVESTTSDTVTTTVDRKVEPSPNQPVDPLAPADGQAAPSDDASPAPRADPLAN